MSPINPVRCPCSAQQLIQRFVSRSCSRPQLISSFVPTSTVSVPCIYRGRMYNARRAFIIATNVSSFAFTTTTLICLYIVDSANATGDYRITNSEIGDEDIDSIYHSSVDYQSDLSGNDGHVCSRNTCVPTQAIQNLLLGMNISHGLRPVTLHLYYIRHGFETRV
ncbi:hypothetical protein GGR58DRAFT_483293 [Xylaria digitata]|nr:hypothetical protein GGR58DRAFT_483293 [Xylaria digitata]